MYTQVPQEKRYGFVEDTRISEVESFELGAGQLTDNRYTMPFCIQSMTFTPSKTH